MARFPLTYSKHKAKPLFTPEHFLAYMRRRGRIRGNCPKCVILCWKKEVIDIIKHRFKPTVTRSIFGPPLLVFDYKGKKIAAVRIEGIGAPHAVTVLEELIALGAKYFIALGYAGGLQRVNKPGDLILVTKAIRDEGTSYHYATPSKYSYSSKELNAALKKTIKQNSQQFFEGGAWTTDAPYKETIPEIKIYKKEGTLAVEMEASALFTVAKYRKAHFSQLLTLSDILSEKEWIPKFHAGAIRKAFKQMVQIAIDSFAQLK